MSYTPNILRVRDKDEKGRLRMDGLYIIKV